MKDFVLLQSIVYCLRITLARSDIPRNCLVFKNGTAITGTVDMDLRKKFITDGLEITNKLRELHGSPPLTLNVDLCQSAQWVSDAYFDRKWDSKWRTDFHAQELDPEIILSCSENTWVSPFVDWENQAVSPSDPLMTWYSEIRLYNFKEGKPRSRDNITHHFTTMIWKGIKEMCVTYAKAPVGKLTYVVAHYYPQGNIPSEFLKNVKPTVHGSSSAYSFRSSPLLPNIGTLIFILLVNGVRKQRGWK